jgi:RNA polymerase sigma-70 factor (ECF subfamily)
VRADLLRRLGRTDEARTAYRAALALDPAPAERRWLERRLQALAATEDLPPALSRPLRESR